MQLGSVDAAPHAGPWLVYQARLLWIMFHVPCSMFHVGVVGGCRRWSCLHAKTCISSVVVCRQPWGEPHLHLSLVTPSTVPKHVGPATKERSRLHFCFPWTRGCTLERQRLACVSGSSSLFELQRLPASRSCRHVTSSEARQAACCCGVGKHCAVLCRFLCRVALCEPSIKRSVVGGMLEEN